MAGSFSCSDGKVLDQDDVREMLAYDNAGVVRPDAYDDVVFDATSVKGAVYRCKTADEKKAEKEGAARAKEEADWMEKRVAEIRNKAGLPTAMAPTNAPPARTIVNDTGPEVTTGTATR